MEWTVRLKMRPGLEPELLLRLQEKTAFQWLGSRSIQPLYVQLEALISAPVRVNSVPLLRGRRHLDLPNLCLSFAGAEEEEHPQGQGITEI